MEPNQRLEYVVSNLIRFRMLWLVPAVAGVLLAVVYVFLFRADTWSARQSLIVRDDLLGQSFKPGHFNSLESMKSAQETILEIARKPQTLRSVLEKLGPAKTSLFSNASSYPDDKTIEDVQGMISFSAPNGAEFGKTEVIILNTKSTSPERSLAFTQLLLDEIDVRISDVRGQRLQSMESELKQARDGAALSLKQAMDRLREMEGSLGADIGTMNGLNSTQPSDGSAKLEIHQISIEKRTAQIELDAASKAKELLAAAKKNPEKLLSTSADFLKSQPMLENLQKSLVDAQKAYADNIGRFESVHPAVKSSAQTIEAMRQQIYQELDNITQAVESRIGELQTRIARQNSLIDKETEKLVSLGSKRIDHFTINAEVAKKTEIYNLAETRMAEVQALTMTTGQVEWLTRMGDPQLSTRPDGMGKKAVLMAGGCCGLMFGLGLVMLVAPPIEPPASNRPGRRSDSLRNVNETGKDMNMTSIDSKTRSLATKRAHLPSPTLDEMLGPSAASAIHSASAATAATVSRGVSFAKSAFEKTRSKSGSKIAVKIPHVSPQELERAAGPSAETTGGQSKKDERSAVPSRTNPAEAKSPLTESRQSEPLQAATMQTLKPRTAESERVKSEGVRPQPNNAAATSAVATPVDTTPTQANSAGELGASALPEVESYNAGNQSPAERMLAEIRSTLSVQSEYEMSPSTHAPQPQEAPAKPPQKSSNVRPIDILKSNLAEKKAEAVQSGSRESAATLPVSLPTVQNTGRPTTPSPSETTPSIRSPKENPFLKNLPKPKPAVENSANKIQLGPNVEQMMADRQASARGTDAASPSSQRPKSQTQTIPDQVKNLAATIANFAHPQGE